jgi:DNA-binding NarL/FixJ family response regulator
MAVPFGTVPAQSNDYECRRGYLAAADEMQFSSFLKHAPVGLALCQSPGNVTSRNSVFDELLRMPSSQTPCAFPELIRDGAGSRRLERRPEAVVIVVTGYGTVQSAVQAMKNGAYDYVTKPFSVDELKLLLERVSSHLQLKAENRLLREKVKSKQGFGGSWAEPHKR